MKVENILKLAKYCEQYDDFICYADGLTCSNCIHGDKLLEKLLEIIEKRT